MPVSQTFFDAKEKGLIPSGFRLFFSVLCSLAFFFAPFSQSKQDADTKKSAPHAPVAHPITAYFDGWSPFIRTYSKEILAHLLAQSEEKYGPYKLEYYKQELTPARRQREIALGKNIHLDFSTMLVSDEQRRSISQQQIPLFGGLLGLRSLIVPKSERSKYNDTLSLQEFRTFIAGQGKGWPDVKIYRNANLKVVERPFTKNLFPMLAANRYDYFPLSIIEVDEALRETKNLGDKLTVARNVYIYYPIPVYLNVTKKNTDLSQRVNWGFNRLVESGEFSLIMRKYLARHYESISPDRATVFYMENPSISASENKRMIDDLLKKYFSEKTRTFDLNSN